MDLYEIKARGLRGPLNSREISHLFRIGYLHPGVPCKAKDEATWRTIGEFFPLLEYGIGKYTLPPDDAVVARRLPLKRLCLLLLALAGLGAFYVYHQPAPESAALPAPARAPQTAPPTVLALNN